MTAVLVLLDNIPLSYGVLYCSLDLFSTYFSYQNLVWKICWIRLKGTQGRSKKKVLLYEWISSHGMLAFTYLPLFSWFLAEKKKEIQNCYILCSFTVVGKIILWARRSYEMVFWRRPSLPYVTTPHCGIMCFLTELIWQTGDLPFHNVNSVMHSTIWSLYLSCHIPDYLWIFSKKNCHFIKDIILDQNVPSRVNLHSFTYE